MVDDAGIAQAKALLSEMYGHVADISHKLEAAEARTSRARARGNTRKDPVAGLLRRELYEAHRLIDGLHRRYPQTVPDSRRSTRTHHRHALGASPPSTISS
ncbi:hypothetical protein [Mycolicibacterium sp.]|uniref:hypothetical protein n=1 Tax=Mycolicibacterium sp. TaxID=2320850 RepID=UPI001A304727|nr:hypothetical protein [Mycolicibacterium sp.]MBJ7340680.1 hypothetical protein [Mycolicibacterium sp.]